MACRPTLFGNIYLIILSCLCFFIIRLVCICTIKYIRWFGLEHIIFNNYKLWLNFTIIFLMVVVGNKLGFLNRYINKIVY